MIPEFPTVVALQADADGHLSGTDETKAIKYKWLVADNPAAGTPKTNGWTWQASAVQPAWIEAASKDINVRPSEPIIVEYVGGGSLKPVALEKTAGNAYAAKVGASPLMLAKVVDNTATTEKYTGYYFKAPAQGYGYLAF